MQIAVGLKLQTNSSTNQYSIWAIVNQFNKVICKYAVCSAFPAGSLAERLSAFTFPKERFSS